MSKAKVTFPSAAGLEYWTESEDAAVQQSTIFTPNNSATDVNAVILPKGTGSFIASIPDGTTTGGDSRGLNSVDLQTDVRSDSTQVASGDYSVVLGGRRNTASAEIAGVLSGADNNSSGIGAVIAGGGGNSASGILAFIGAGNDHIASGLQSVICGGFNNQATNTAATIGGGTINTSTNINSVVSGGQRNNATGFGSSISGGYDNTSSGQYSHTVGRQNTAEADYSAGAGYQSITHLFAQNSHASGRFNVSGDAQEFTVLARRQAQLTTGATTVLTLDGTGTTNPIIVRTGAGSSAHTVWNVVASWAAVVTSISGTATGVNVGDVITQCNLFGFKEYSETPSIIGSVSNVGTHNDASMASATMTFGAAGTNQLTLTFAAPTFAGGGTLTMRVLCKLMITSIEF